MSADSYRGEAKEFQPDKVADGNPDTYWATDDAVTTGLVTLEFAAPEEVHYVVIQEYIKLGQRVKKFSVEANVDGRWKKLASGTTIGYKRILRLEPVRARAIRVVIEEAKGSVVLSEVGVY